MVCIANRFDGNTVPSFDIPLEGKRERDVKATYVSFQVYIKDLRFLILAETNLMLPLLLFFYTK